MAEYKFKRGQTVKILSRKDLREGGNVNNWENSHVGGYAIIVEVKTEVSIVSSSYTDSTLYSLLLLDKEGLKLRKAYWFEEKYLELYCSNELRGLTILDSTNL